MAHVSSEKVDDVNIKIQVKITPEDYATKYLTELKKQRREASLKGFRKGKAPMGFIKKAFGPSVLPNVVSEILRTELSAFLEDQSLKFFGYPMTASDQEEIDFNPNNTSETFHFLFDLGLKPDFELAGMDENLSFDQFKVEVTDAMIEKELKVGLEKMGEEKEVEDSIEEDDFIHLEIAEMDGEAIKVGGYRSSFEIQAKEIKEDKLREEVLKQKTGFSFPFNIFELVKDSTDTQVYKEFLQLPDDADREAIGSDFQATITKVRRMFLAELNEDFFQNYFRNPEIKSEEDARTFLSKEFRNLYDQQAETLLFSSIRDHLIEQNPFDLPRDFLRNWLIVSDEKATEQSVDQQLPQFMESLRWSEIRGKLVEKFDVAVNEEEIKQALRKKYENIGAQLGNVDINQVVEYALQNEEAKEEAKHEAEGEKVFEIMKSFFKVEEKEISSTEFDMQMLEFRRKAFEKQYGTISNEEE